MSEEMTEAIKPSDENEKDLDEITIESDISQPNRRICVATTAALPWRTGTSVNPLLRALYLTRGRPSKYITLVIPWLDDEASQQKLFGHVFASEQEQEEWIRTYSRDRAHCPEEEAKLDIIFYKASYHKSFGSIFPLVDICSLIPEEEADVAILEEPEHLNWFRVPARVKATNRVRAIQNTLSKSNVSGSSKEDTNKDEESDGSNGNEEIREKEELGWKYRFRHVVGILHTNYSAYMKQYGIGTSLIGAPAIGVLSSIVVKAYCHRVIRLSAVLPSLAPGKEVTSNVHGVRAEFLQSFVIQENDSDEDKLENPAAVYFIGKIIWAKGFDKMLDIQDMYRKETGDYFPIDVYGSGPDEKGIKRAFFGRRGAQQGDRTSSQDSSNAESSNSQTGAPDVGADIFTSQKSLREQVYAEGVDEFHQEDTIAVTPKSEEMEATRKSSAMAILGDFSGTSVGTAVATSQAVYKLAEKAVCHGLCMTTTWEDNGQDSSTQTEERSTNNFEEWRKNPGNFTFDPPQSRHEWRKNPIPARFLGVKDHALLKGIPDHKIFLNPSVTEVLCTTTAEALAMGKFVIIPKHPSNEFFLQFPNCLAYESLTECLEKLKWALNNDPPPLSPELERIFTWEAATERLYEASRVTKRESRERDNVKGRTPLAQLHVEFLKKGQFITNLFSGDKGDEPGSLSSTEH